MSATKLGENKAITYNKSRAAGSGTKLTLHFTEPNIISMMLTSEKQVAGIDAVIKYNKDMLSILSSTLIGGADFTTSGGTVNEDAGTFSFSSLAKPSFKNTGVVAMFEIRSKEGVANPATEMTFDVQTNVQQWLKKLQEETSSKIPLDPNSQLLQNEKTDSSSIYFYFIFN